ncbi:MAG: FecR domain-containing protein [Deltaproteobacteria bacterium]|nr:FecR domain-containing protein [Deltaproteobacteria bacterium]
MKKGRVLIGLAITILFFMALTATDLLSQANRGGAVPVDRLPERLKGIDIKDYFVKSNFKRVGVIHAMIGTVIVIHKADKSAYFGKEGDYIYENDSLETLSDSKCRLKFINHDVVSMSVNSNIDVDEVALDRRKQEKKSFFSMLKGKAMFYSLRLFSVKKNNMRLKTPTAVVGVRGTKFGVDIYKLDERTGESRGILLAEAGNSIPRFAQFPGGGPPPVTDLYNYDSPLTINNKRVGPNTLWFHGTPMPATREQLERFEQDVNLPGFGPPPTGPIPLFSSQGTYTPPELLDPVDPSELRTEGGDDFHFGYGGYPH